MNWHRYLAAVFVTLVLVGCAHPVTGWGQAPYPHESGADMRGGGGM
jgi:hypothetical protein